jgi:subfamily B ATP-binding cassette protein MsbA
MSEFLGVLVLSCILWFGGILVLNHEAGLSPENFITYILFFTQIINPAKALSTAFYNAQRGAAAIERIEEILKAPITVIDDPAAKPIPAFTDSIEFKNVSFYYDDTAILKNINLTIKKGKTIALECTHILSP